MEACEMIVNEGVKIIYLGIPQDWREIDILIGEILEKNDRENTEINNFIVEKVNYLAEGLELDIKDQLEWLCCMMLQLGRTQLKNQIEEL